MSIRKKLEVELSEVRFSETAKEELKQTLRSAVQKQQKPTLRSRLVEFWQGETVISLPVATVVLAVLVLGGWQIYTTVNVLEPSQFLLFETKPESVRLIEQGVSVL